MTDNPLGLTLIPDSTPMTKLEEIERETPRQWPAEASVTRGEVLRYAIAYALRAKEELSEPERYAVADHVVDQLKQRGDPWHLNNEAPPVQPPTT